DGRYLFLAPWKPCCCFISGVLEHGHEIRDANLVVVAEQGLAMDLLVVNPRPVVSPHVLDIPFPLLEPELRVLPTDPRRVDDKLAVGIAPDNEAVDVERDSLPRAHAGLLGDPERCHLLVSKSGKSGS